MRYDHKGRSTDGFKGFWPGNPPADCPFPRDRQHDRVVFTGRYANYTNADTWYPSWASDGHLYSPWTDGYILNDSPSTYQPFEDAHPHHACNSLFFMGRNPATAQAKIVGDDPMNLTIVDLQPRVDGLPWPDMTDGVAKFHGRYPCGSLVYNGVWYYGTYLLENWPDRHCGGVGWTMQGPFVGFRLSHDFGKTWTDSPCTPDKPLFPEDPRVAPVKFAAPHFVDFGKNMQHSPDGYAYLTAHGSLCPDAWNNWIQGDCIFLARVKPSPETMNDLSAYEFFAGHDEKGEPIYTRYLGRAMPLLEWAGRLGCVTATYNSALRKFILCVTRGHSGGHHDTMLLTADRITGPWSLLEWLGDFGPEAYFVNIPSKFISSDGLTLWLCYSANWSNKNTPGSPEGSHYSLSLREVRLQPAR